MDFCSNGECQCLKSVEHMIVTKSSRQASEDTGRMLHNQCYLTLSQLSLVNSEMYKGIRPGLEPDMLCKNIKFVQPTQSHLI